MRAFATQPPYQTFDDPRRPRARRGDFSSSTPRGIARDLSCCVECMMKSGIATVTEDASIAEVRRLLLDDHAGTVPVVDSRERPVGVVTGGDLLRAAAEGRSPILVREVMTSLVFALPISAALAQAAALIAYEGVRLIVICDLDGRVAGVVSALDIARWCARSAGYLVDH